MTVHHADFAIAVNQRIEVTTSVGVNGRVIAIGWWVQPDVEDNPDHQPTGNLYLIVDPSHPRPMWVAQADLTSTALLDHD
jgi:hypothetical protein